MLEQRLRRWSNITPTVGQRVVFAEQGPGCISVDYSTCSQCVVLLVCGHEWLAL